MEEADFILSQDLTQHLDRVFLAALDLWNSLKSNSCPDVLLRDLLGLSQSQINQLPRYLLGFLLLWLLCGGTTLWLHFQKGQKSLNLWSRQVANILLTWADIFFLPLLVITAQIGKEALASVPPYSGEWSDLWRFFSQAWGTLFDPILIFCLLLFTILLPLQSALDYLKRYHLSGLPHMIFDVGTGCYIACAALLSMLTENRLWYFMVPLGVVLLCVAQIGGAAKPLRVSPPPVEVTQRSEESS